MKDTGREEILKEAKKCVCGQRQEDYGSPEDTFNTISGFWSIYLGHRITKEDVAAMMALMKLARISGGPGTKDSWVDLAGYAACGGEMYLNRVKMENELLRDSVESNGGTDC